MAEKFTIRSLADKYKDFTSPSAAVLLDGGEIETDEGIRLEQVEVHTAVFAEPSMAILYYRVSNIGTQYTSRVESKACVGSRLEVKAGYGQSLTRIFYGYVHEVSAAWYGEEYTVYELVGLDVKGLMQLNNVFGTSSSKKTQQIVSDILNHEMYLPFLESREEEQLPACMNDICMISGESHYEWLCRLAEYLHYEFFIVNGKLFFRRAGRKAGEATELSWEFGLQQIRSFATMSSRAACIRAAGYGKKGERILGRAERKAAAGPFSGKAASLAGSRLYLDMSLSSQEQADYRAKALMQETEDGYGGMEAVCVGIPELVPGGFIRITDRNKGSLSGVIYVEEVTHRLGADGYLTTVKGRR